MGPTSEFVGARPLAAFIVSGARDGDVFVAEWRDREAVREREREREEEIGPTGATGCDKFEPIDATMGRRILTGRWVRTSTGRDWVSARPTWTILSS